MLQKHYYVCWNIWVCKSKMLRVEYFKKKNKFSYLNFKL